jgi:hypothetical protein
MSETKDPYVYRIKSVTKVVEVTTGFECGVQCNGFSDWQVGDRIEIYNTSTKKGV